MPSDKNQSKNDDIVSQVAERIRTSDNVLVALSKDPSVDELSAALGLTFILDKLGKHATAIFSGAVPNAIEFLEPEKTFEVNTNSLQDFIIALDKDKADHVRYKIDGDYVKILITPYKTTIDEDDMEFSHGDYNVDLVIALNVAKVEDLDSALSEYGRIMHDASSINITASVPGKFGDLEWGDPAASSVSEMIGKLCDAIKEKDKVLIDKTVATALLAGIVAATNRFSNERTTPDTMSMASRLMSAGANQQLISSSIPVDILTSNVVDANADATETDTTPIATTNTPVAQPAAQPVAAQPVVPQDPTNLVIQHGAVDFNPDDDDLNPAAAPATPATATPTQPVSAAAEAPSAPLANTSSMIPGVKAEGPAAVPSGPDQSELATAANTQSVALPESDAEKASAEAALDQMVSNPTSSDGSGPLMEELKNAALSDGKRTIMPLNDHIEYEDGRKDYSSAMAAELGETTPPVAPTAPASSAAPTPAPMAPPTATMVSSIPQENASAEAEYVAPLPMPNANDILPPPPIPFDPAVATGQIPSAQEVVQSMQMESPVAAPAPEPTPQPEVIQPEMAQPQLVAAEPAMPAVAMPAPVVDTPTVAAPDPSAFKIPGM